MSENEKINEMDAAEMLEGYRAENRQAEPAEDPVELEILEMIKGFDADAKKWNHRQGWEAFGMCLVSALVVVSCCAAALYGVWKPVIMGIGAAHLMLAGAWWQKAKTGWSA